MVRQSDISASFAAVDSRMGGVTAGFSQWGPLSTLYARHFPSPSRKADYFHLIHQTTPYQHLSTANHTLTTLDHTRPRSITIYHA